MIRYLINQFIISSFLYIGKIDELDYSVLSIFWESKEIDGVQNAMLSKLNELAEGKKKTFDDDSNAEDDTQNMEDFSSKEASENQEGHLLKNNSNIWPCEIKQNQEPCAKKHWTTTKPVKMKRDNG